MKKKSKIFSGLNIYYSGSIRGVPESDPEFPWKLVQFMIQNGADVLSEHVAARNKDEMVKIFAKRSGHNRYEEIEPWWIAREVDMRWVDEATHVVALVNGSSHGVGMELERAIHKPERGLNETPILCLIREDLLPGLSSMIRGVSKKEHPKFYIKTYSDFKSATDLINEFLLGRLK